MSTKNDYAWEQAFREYNILENIKQTGQHIIEAEELKPFRDARLMNKVDHRESLPQIMKDHGLSILAISNTKGLISKADPFLDIEFYSEKTIQVISPHENRIAIDHTNITSESEAIDLCHNCKSTTSLCGEETDLQIRGRTYNDVPSSFRLDNITYDLDDVQIEADSGYEGDIAIHLIEVKIGFHDNISIRQLLYPHLLWQQRRNKEIRSYLLLYYNKIFRFIPYIYEGYGKGYLDQSNEHLFQITTLPIEY